MELQSSMALSVMMTDTSVLDIENKYGHTFTLGLHGYQVICVCHGPTKAIGKGGGETLCQYSIGVRDTSTTGTCARAYEIPKGKLTEAIYDCMKPLIEISGGQSCPC